MLRLVCAASLPLILTAFAAAAQTPTASVSTAGLPRPANAQTARPIQFAATLPEQGGALVLPLASASDLSQRGGALDAATRDSIARALTAADYKYAARGLVSLRGVGSWNRIVIVGLGDQADEAVFQNAGLTAGRALLQEKGPVVVLANGLSAQAVSGFATGMGMGQYRPDLYASVDRKPSPSEAITIVNDAAADARALYERRGAALVSAVAWTRDISNEPANVVYPEVFVTRARAAFAGIPGVTVEALDVPTMERLGMGALLGVGRGSQREPRLLVVRYRGAGAPAGGPVVLAGKGITFDSGGISIKPSANMGDMKFDMSGAASVVGAALSLAGARAPVNVVAIAALAENMPSGSAIRPGDILRAMNGKTIEIGSTDAEGRLVLADAVAWADAKLSPAAIVDVATLTGAVGTALSDDYAGLFSRNDALASQLSTAATATGEAVWRLPLHPSYKEDIASAYADMRNGGGSGGGAGIGAHFIGEFVKPTTPWAHLDIASVAWAKSASDNAPAGSTAWGVRLLDRFVRDFKPVAGTP